MKTWGVRFLVIGVLSLILPFFGLQFKVMQLFGNSIFSSAILILIGIGLLISAQNSKQQGPSVPTMIIVSTMGIALTIAFGLTFAKFFKSKADVAKNETEEAQSQSPADLYAQCFKYQLGASCRQLAAYYQSNGDQPSALTSLKTACNLGDQVACGLGRQPSSM